MKKILVITMALCVLGAFVAGCSAPAEPTTPATTAGETPKDPAAEGEK